MLVATMALLMSLVVAMPKVKQENAGGSKRRIHGKSANENNGHDDDDDDADATIKRLRQSNMMTQLSNAAKRIGTSKEQDGDDEKAAAFNLYRSFSRFDQRKTDMLAKWEKDKSCKSWLNTYQQKDLKAESVKFEGVTGYGTKHDVATFLNLPVEHAIVQAVLEELPQDDDWNDEDMMQRAYKKANEKRYNLMGLKKSCGKEDTTWKHEESIESSKSSKDKKLADAAEGNDTVAVEIKNPLYVEFHALLTVLKSAFTSLEKVSSQARKETSNLKMKAQRDATYLPKSVEFSKHTEVYADFLSELSDYIAAGELLEVDIATQSDIDAATTMKDNCASHEKAMRDRIKQIKALLK